ncbi:hypothetical protein V3C99_001075, partial [Haemonchus contortus]
VRRCTSHIKGCTAVGCSISCCSSTTERIGPTTEPTCSAADAATAGCACGAETRAGTITHETAVS